MPRCLFAAGVLVLAAAWAGPLAAIARGTFSAHMTVHIAVVAVAAPLFATALAGGPFDPARRHPSLFAPLPASIIELVLGSTSHHLTHHAGRPLVIVP